MKDCYEVFAKKIAKAEFPNSLDELIAECELDIAEEEGDDGNED